MNLALTWVEGKCLNSRGVRAWAASLRKHSPETRIVILSPQPVQVEHVENVVLKVPGGRPLHRRWCAYSDFLSSLVANHSSVDFVLFSDSRDLIFQTDPFVIAEPDATILVSEQQKTADHSWCEKKALELQQKLGWPQDLKRTEINGGIQLGPLIAMRQFAQAMELGMFCGADTDQALLNWWFRHRCTDPWKFAPEGWYVHGEAVKLGRQKIEIKEGIARDRRSQTAATIWHQYDRVPGHEAIAQAGFMPPRPPLGETRILLLVAHYNEPLKWLDEFSYETLVVSKNGQHPPGAIARPNVGNEAETWAWFFAEHYDELPEITVCLQGKPFDHVRPDTFRQMLQRIQTEKNFSYIPISNPGHKGWTGLDTPDHHGIPIKEWWARLFKTPPPLNWYTPYGGQFAVHRDAVRQRSREYWQMIRDNCKTRNDACTLERLWQFILMGLP